MMDSRNAFVGLSLSLGLFVAINCHPQCLDFRAPFDLREPLSFCTQYSGFTCCTLEKDLNLKRDYEAIKSSVQSDGISGCESYIKELLCQQCSPYAAHIYDAEDSGRVEQQVPGLCDGYCRSFYPKCKDIIPHMYDINMYTKPLGITIRVALQQQETFCASVRLSDNDYCYPELLTNPTLNGLISRETHTQKGCLCLDQLAQDLGNPLAFRSPPDDSGRIFIAEQAGLVHIYYKNKTKLPEPFMDVRDIVLTSSRRGEERGFLNLAFHPNFKENQKLYIYISIDTSNSDHVRVSEFKVSDLDKNKVDRHSERVILEVRQPYWNHNGGEMMFGIDGYLYLFLGDGGAGGDPQGFAQNKGELLGKVLRIDVDTGDPSMPYRVPSDNPFVGEQGTREEIWAYGVRNIWRCDLDEGDPVTGYGRGRIICGDVGQSAQEEIDLIIKGGNYGWNAREGTACYRSSLCGKIGPEELPIFSYPHSEGKSVTGGHVYRGCMNPNLQGQYIYGDYVNGRIWSLEEKEGNWVNKDISMCGSDVCFNGLTGRYPSHILSFGEDDDGEIYILSTSYASASEKVGKVFKLVDPLRRGDPTTCRSYVPPSTTTTTTTTTTARTTTTNKQTQPSEGSVTLSREINGSNSRYVEITTCVLLPIVTCITYYL